MDLKPLAAGANGAVYKAKYRVSNNDAFTNDQDFNLVVKKLFNYCDDRVTDPGLIPQCMHRECLTLRRDGSKMDIDTLLRDSSPHLSYHPFVVEVLAAFLDDVIITDQSQRDFPAAMPRQLNPDVCFGHTQTLYLIMDRRPSTLRSFLSNNPNISMVTRCLLVAQLFEGLAHLSDHGVAHRDLKTDNILVTEVNGEVRLEICDFGCCLAPKDGDLRVRYPDLHRSKGGNACLLPPEIALAEPGPHKVLDFYKSDIWAAGAIAYEIFGLANPFYPNQNIHHKNLSASEYAESDLPPLPVGVPLSLQRLVASALSRDPGDRPSLRLAAVVAQISALVLYDRCQYKSQRRLNVSMESIQLEALMVETWLIFFVSSVFYSLLYHGIGSSGKISELSPVDVVRFLLLKRLHYQDLIQAVPFFLES